MTVSRTPPRGKFKGTIFSSDIVGAMTHYARSRTQICTRPNCPECKDHHLPRWYGYLAIYNPINMSRTLFEFPAGPIGTFHDYLQKYRNFRGARITAFRKPERANGPVQITLTPPDDQLLKHPEEVDVFRLLCQLWKVSHIDQLEAYNRSNLKDQPGLAPTLSIIDPTKSQTAIDAAITLRHPAAEPFPSIKRDDTTNGTDHT